MEAIVALFYWTFYHGAHARVTPMSEFRNGEFCFSFGMYHVGIKDCTTSFFVKPTVQSPMGFWSSQLSLIRASFQRNLIVLIPLFTSLPKKGVWPEAQRKRRQLCRNNVRLRRNNVNTLLNPVRKLYQLCSNPRCRSYHGS